MAQRLSDREYEHVTIFGKPALFIPHRVNSKNRKSLPYDISVYELQGSEEMIDAYPVSVQHCVEDRDKLIGSLIMVKSVDLDLQRFDVRIIEEGDFEYDGYSITVDEYIEEKM